MKKIIVAPQIVIYKNFFKHNSELINILKNDNNDSQFCNWNKWYEQGFRKNCVHTISENPNEVNKEKKYLDEFCNIINFIKKDYFSEFENENGIWPSFISDWEFLKKEIKTFEIDYFKYDIEKLKDRQEDKLLMEYHVDDFLIYDNVKHSRHIATINLYLNDDYSGGEICAYDSITKKSYKFKPSAGDFIIMPSTKPFYHAVKVFKKADRYFLRTFIDYPVDGIKDINQYNKEYENYIFNDRQMLKIKLDEETVE